MKSDLTGKAQLGLSPYAVVAATDAEESATVPANLADNGKAGASTKGSPHADFYTKIFGLSLATLLAASLVLNAASPSTPMCKQSDRDFGTTGIDSASTHFVAALGGGLQAEPFGTIRSKECATKQAGDEPGY